MVSHRERLSPYVKVIPEDDHVSTDLSVFPRELLLFGAEWVPSPIMEAFTARVGERIASLTVRSMDFVNLQNLLAFLTNFTALEVLWLDGCVWWDPDHSEQSSNDERHYACTLPTIFSSSASLRLDCLGFEIPLLRCILNSSQLKISVLSLNCGQVADVSVLSTFLGALEPELRELTLSINHRESPVECELPDCMVMISEL